MAAKDLVSVKLNSGRVGNTLDKDGRVCGMFAQAVGDIVQMPADEAQRYIEKGLASPAPKEKQ